MENNCNHARRAVVLLSGGLDSAVTLAEAAGRGLECYSISFDYGQRNRNELDAAAAVSRALGACDHKIISLDLRSIGGSALTSDMMEVPRGKKPDYAENRIPPTYVPARNTIFLSVGLAAAEVLEARDIFIGVNAVDYSGYPDCRPEYIRAFEQMANLATRAAVEKKQGIKLRTPLIDMSKAQIIKRGAALGVDFSVTSSCYDPPSRGTACGTCDSCRLRKKGFEEAEIPDPTVYADQQK